MVPALMPDWHSVGNAATAQPDQDRPDETDQDGSKHQDDDKARHFDSFPESTTNDLSEADRFPDVRPLCYDHNDAVLPIEH
jgi:hypothetical protein